MLRAYKYRLYPTEAQALFFVKTIGCTRFIYNRLLADRIAIYEATKQNPGIKQKFPTPASYKPEFPFLREADSLALANANLNLNEAFEKFFTGSGGFPKFKTKRHSRASYTTNNQHGTVRIEGEKIRLPKIGFVRFKQHRLFHGLIRSATISMTRTRKFFVSLLILEQEIESAPGNHLVGIDLGLQHFAILTNDNLVTKKVINPRFFRKSEEKIKRAQRAMSRKKVGSKNREKARLILAKKHEKIANQRNDFLHKLSKSIVDENQVIVIETLKPKNMIQDSHLAKSISDASWSEFIRQLKYKATFYGRTLITADQWFASTQICSCCGKDDGQKPLGVRTWTCSSCGADHDRDVNASINLLLLAKNH
ncbi:IS200/IS605 family element RNA-guided endonuclease TnpB [Exiguobacterium sp. s50]|uniref:IS200/IS605 family element RNA-guided endonuclease TnpB n=1 Tax=Exiguobacterium sp. s50 TaxID=2751234 RepID=UPI001BEC45E9|nr:IS200/IS605 family element RNA-guided endonuclease TnpB [Exiguobacterium sp. s50]